VAYRSFCILLLLLFIRLSPFWTRALRLFPRFFRAGRLGPLTLVRAAAATRTGARSAARAFFLLFHPQRWHIVKSGLRAPHKQHATIWRKLQSGHRAARGDRHRDDVPAIQALTANQERLWSMVAWPSTKSHPSSKSQGRCEIHMRKTCDRETWRTT